MGLEAKGQFYYGLRQTFGKNRVQYNEFDWVFYRFDRFDIYFYRGNDDLASQVARMTDENLPKIESFFDAALDERVQILVFNNLSDLKQSNVNSNNDEDYNTGGVTRISGRRLFVYFDGDMLHLEQQLRSGLAEVVMSNLIYGSFTQSIKNSTLLNLPEWYTEGLISFVGKPYSVELDTRLRDGILTERYKKINSLTQQDARFAGHSFWYYISQTYGSSVIKNIVYMSIVNRNIESGFSYILGKNIKEVTEGWWNFYEEMYKNPDGATEADEEEDDEFRKVPKGYVITRMETSPDGRYLVYVCQKFSEYKVYLYDLERGKKKRILKGGYKIAQNTDYSYPLLAWHPNSNILSMITEEKGFIFLNYYNLEKKELEKKKFFKFDKILSYRYNSDGKKFLMSAVKDGQSDIFIYTILNTKVEQLTNDSYNDLYPIFIQNDKRVVFSSNRVTDTVIKKEEANRFIRKSHDLFSMAAAEPKEDTTVIWRLTNTPNIDELNAENHEKGYFSFLTNRGGIQNSNIIKIDSSIAYIDTSTHYEYSFKEYVLTNSDRNILDMSVNPERDKTYSLVFKDRRYRILESEFKSGADLQLEPIRKPAAQSGTGEDGNKREKAFSSTREGNASLYYPGLKPEDYEVNIDDYRFENEEDIRKSGKKEKPEAKPVPVESLPQTVTQVGKPAEEEELIIPPKRNYFLSFYQDDFAVKFDNIFDNPQYQAFTGFVSSDLLNAGFNMQFKAGVMDLMHNYRIIGGVRTNFQPLSGTSLTPNAEFYVALVDYKNRLDKEYVYSRRSRVLFLAFNNYQRVITHEPTFKVSWPLSPVAAFRGSVGYRIDQTVKLSTDLSSADDPNIYQDYAVIRASYVYDNTRKLGLNLYAGLRYKIFTEYYHNLKTRPSGLHTAGIDLRHYTVLYRNLIWANRFAFGTSFGPEKLIYIMGGVDNSFSPRFEPTTPIATENNYIFQTLVTNMRGLFQNVRNGNSFALINSELRWPIFSFLSSRPIKSDFFKNFQIIGFGDVGTAWNGLSPYSRENAINNRTIDYGNLRIELDSQKEPIVGGIGVGARTRLFGYFVRFDAAWGIEDNIILSPLYTVSLSTDF